MITHFSFFFKLYHNLEVAHVSTLVVVHAKDFTGLLVFSVPYVLPFCI